MISHDDQPSTTSIDEGIDSASQLTFNASSSTGTTFTCTSSKFSSQKHCHETLCSDADNDSLHSRVCTSKRMVDRNGYDIPIETKIRIISGRMSSKNGEEFGETTSGKKVAVSGLNCTPTNSQLEPFLFRCVCFAFQRKDRFIAL